MPACPHLVRWLLLVGVAAGALGLPAPAAAQPDPGWDYTVRLDAGLREAQVRLCFRGLLPRRLVEAAEGAQAAFSFDRPATPGAARLDRAAGGGVVPVGLAPGGCVAWRVDLDRALDVGGRGASRVGRDLVLPPGLLLLRPALWPADARATVRFELPAGYRAAVPWPRLDGGAYALDEQALGLRGLVAIGRFPADEIAVAGTTLDVAVLDAPHRATPEGIHAWLRGAAAAVADLYGRFPAPRVTVIVQPVPARAPAVLFGQAMRAGGSHVHLLLAAAAPDEELPGEWVAVHEMMHLGMPWTYDTEAWLQEGFVTYYQEVLRARAGFLTEQEAWQNIHDGFGRGRLRGGEDALARESATMAQTHNYWRVYWAGAAVALLLDVELRRRWPGQRSLDDVMRLLWERFGMRAPQRGVVMLRAVDGWLGQSLCSVVAETCLARSSFPDVWGAYAALGLSVVDGRIVLRDDAPQAADRARIMRPSVR